MMMQKDPIVGQRVPWTPGESAVGEPILDKEGKAAVAWYILRTAPQKEVAACARLRRMGVADAWFPIQKLKRTRRGVKGLVEIERRVAPGYVFTAWDRQPRWHVIKDRANGTVTSVVSVGDKPWAIPEHLIALMAQVPARIEELRREEEARRLAERLANVPRPGDLARLVDGPLAGQTVLVEEVKDREATFSLGSAKGSVDLASLERVS